MNSRTFHNRNYTTDYTFSALHWLNFKLLVGKCSIKKIINGQPHNTTQTQGKHFWLHSMSEFCPHRTMTSLVRWSELLKTYVRCYPIKKALLFYFEIRTKISKEVLCDDDDNESCIFVPTIMWLPFSNHKTSNYRQILHSAFELCMLFTLRLPT